jgi:tetratricopeptide (TPR) repeat protein
MKQFVAVVLIAIFGFASVQLALAEEPIVTQACSSFVYPTSATSPNGRYELVFSENRNRLYRLIIKDRVAKKSFKKEILGRPFQVFNDGYFYVVKNVCGTPQDERFIAGYDFTGELLWKKGIAEYLRTYDEFDGDKPHALLWINSEADVAKSGTLVMTLVNLNQIRISSADGSSTRQVFNGVGFPEDPELLDKYAQYLEGAQQRDKAVTVLKYGLALPSVTQNLVRPKIEGNLISQLAGHYESQNDLNSAEDLYNNFIDKRKSSIIMAKNEDFTCSGTAAWAYFEIAKIALKRGDFSRATELLTQLYRPETADYFPLEEYLQALNTLGKEDEAKQFVDKFVSDTVATFTAMPKRSRGEMIYTIYYLGATIAEAIPEYQFLPVLEATERLMGNVGAYDYSMLADSYAAAGDLQKAYKYWNKAAAKGRSYDHYSATKALIDEAAQDPGKLAAAQKQRDKYAKAISKRERQSDSNLDELDRSLEKLQQAMSEGQTQR